MQKTQAKTLPGFMELLPNEQVLFNQMKETIQKTYEKYGFLPIDTPVIESTEVLLAKAGGETEKQLYSFTKGDSNLTLRFDLTVPLAKYVAMNYNELSFPFRRYQIGKVYRGERAQRGRFREFYQCDIDVIGDGELNIINDAEIPSIMYEVFKRLGLENFTIRINNRKILNGLFEEINAKETSTDIMRIIDKIEKIGEEKVKQEIAELNIQANDIEKIIEFIRIDGTTNEKLEKLEKLNIQNQNFKEGLEELKEVVKYIRLFNVPEDYFTVDVSIARGLDYYTGTVYETFLNDYKKETKKSISDVLVISMIEDLKPAIEVANKLRENGINTEVYFDDKKIKAKFKYADKLKIPNVIVIGEDEIKSGLFTLKNMETGEQSSKSLEEITNILNA